MNLSLQRLKAIQFVRMRSEIATARQLIVCCNLYHFFFLIIQSLFETLRLRVQKIV